MYADAVCRVVVVVAAQTEGDTGYDYNDAYEDSYDESSGRPTDEMIALHPACYTLSQCCPWISMLDTIQNRELVTLIHNAYDLSNGDVVSK